MCGCANLSWWLKENKGNIIKRVGEICGINPETLTIATSRYDGTVYIKYNPNQNSVLLAEFNMRDFHDTESIAIVFRCFVALKFRRRGLGQYLHRLRIRFAKDQKINFLMATTRQTNPVQNHIMKKNGWKIVESYTTDHHKEEMYLWMLDVKSAPSEH